MLVLTTMLTSIANDLPETAEVKYIGNTAERLYRNWEGGDTEMEMETYLKIVIITFHQCSKVVFHFNFCKIYSEVVYIRLLDAFLSVCSRYGNPSPYYRRSSEKIQV